jgi:hypothetical protein
VRRRVDPEPCGVDPRLNHVGREGAGEAPDPWKGCGPMALDWRVKRPQNRATQRYLKHSSRTV